MRTVPMMGGGRGVIVTRPGELAVLQWDSSGKPTVLRMRPQLEPREVLQGRPGLHPAIVRGTYA